MSGGKRLGVGDREKCLKHVQAESRKSGKKVFMGHARKQKNAKGGLQL